MAIKDAIGAWFTEAPQKDEVPPPPIVIMPNPQVLAAELPVIDDVLATQIEEAIASSDTKNQFSYRSYSILASKFRDKDTSKSDAEICQLVMIVAEGVPNTTTSSIVASADLAKAAAYKTAEAAGDAVSIGSESSMFASDAEFETLTNTIEGNEKLIEELRATIIEDRKRLIDVKEEFSKHERAAMADRTSIHTTLKAAIAVIDRDINTLQTTL